jgi:hypothetical protein
MIQTKILLQSKDYLGEYVPTLCHEICSSQCIHLLVFTLDNHQKESPSKLEKSPGKEYASSVMSTDVSGQVSCAGSRKQWLV